LEISTHQKGVLKVLAFGLLCVGFFLAHIWLRTRVVTLGYSVSSERTRLRGLESELAAAKVERARRMGPDSLDRIVRQKEALGEVFAPPRTDQLHYARPTTQGAR